ALREVHGARRVVDDHQAQGDERVDRAGREPAHHDVRHGGGGHGLPRDARSAVVRVSSTRRFVGSTTTPYSRRAASIEMRPARTSSATSATGRSKGSSKPPPPPAC